MKRYGNLYENICNIDNIIYSFNEVCHNTKNKRKVARCKEYQCIYISRIQEILQKRAYTPGPYNKFTIYEPKERLIASQSMQDKIINHLVARFILYPALLPCLLDVNVASRKNLGTQEGLKLANLFNSKCKFFASINQHRLKEKLKKRIKDKEAIKIVFDIIDSESTGLNIGSMTSQVLAIFYLNDMDHFIKEVLKIKYYFRYQDDFLLFHQSKEYLKFCLKQIEIFLDSEKLKLNKKPEYIKILTILYSLDITKKINIPDTEPLKEN